MLPAIRFQVVHAFEILNGVNITSSVDGIAFWTPEGRRVVNWPQHHYENGVAKNERCGGNFKPCVRLFKNARRVAVERGVIVDGLSPSYFIQGLLWNVPDELFSTNHAQTFCDVLSWLRQNRPWYHQFRSQNGADLLFGYTPEQWSVTNAFATEDALASLWNNWQ